MRLDRGSCVHDARGPPRLSNLVILRSRHHTLCSAPPYRSLVKSASQKQKAARRRPLNPPSFLGGLCVAASGSGGVRGGSFGSNNRPQFNRAAAAPSRAGRLVPSTLDRSMLAPWCRRIVGRTLPHHKHGTYCLHFRWFGSFRGPCAPQTVIAHKSSDIPLRSHVMNTLEQYCWITRAPRGTQPGFIGPPPSQSAR